MILFEDFENGIPSTWTQERIIGDYDWVVESGDLGNPTGTTSGSKRIAFRNNTNQTTAYVTRLISPEMNLAKVFQPILCLSYAITAPSMFVKTFFSAFDNAVTTILFFVFTIKL